MLNYVHIRPPLPTEYGKPDSKAI